MKGSNDSFSGPQVSWDEQETANHPVLARFESRNEEETTTSAIKDDFSAMLDSYFQEDFTTKNSQTLPGSSTPMSHSFQTIHAVPEATTNTTTIPPPFISQLASNRSDPFSNTRIDSPKTFSGLWSFLYSIHQHEQRVFKLLCTSPGIDTQLDLRSQIQSCMIEYQRMYPPLIQYLKDSKMMMMTWEKGLTECKNIIHSKKDTSTEDRIDDHPIDSLVEWLSSLQQQIQAQRIEYEVIQRMVEEYPKSGGPVVAPISSSPAGIASLSIPSRLDVSKADSISRNERKASPGDRHSKFWKRSEDDTKMFPKTPPPTPQQVCHPEHYNQRALTMTPLLMIPNSPIAEDVHTQSVMEPKKKKRRKDASLPKRPLSAYNLFFCDQRMAMLQAMGDAPSTGSVHQDLHAPTITSSMNSDAALRRPHRKTHGKISFQDLAKVIGQKWHELDPVAKSVYEQRAQVEKDTYFRVKWEMQQQQEELHQDENVDEE